MKKIIEKMGFAIKVIFTVFMLAVFFGVPAFAQVLERFEDKNIKITSKLYPTYLGWNVHVGSTTQTVPFYYKITATVSGIGETKASPVTTAYTTYSPTSSTNSVRLKWSQVSGATSYTLYKSVDNSSFYFLTNTTLLTFIDDGDAVGAAYSAASPRGGDLDVEDDVTIGDDLAVTGDVTITGGLTVNGMAGAMALYSRTLAQLDLITPGAAGQLYYCSNCTSLAISSGTGTGAFVQSSSTTVHIAIH